MQRLSSVIFLLFLLGVQSGARADHKAARILILGDSLSSAHNMPVDQGWVELFRNNIRSSFPQTTVINASISGETTFGGLERLPRLLELHRPTLLVIELGGNDGLRGLAFAQSTENLRRMLQLASKDGIATMLIGVRMPPNFGAAYSARFEQIYQTLAAEFDVAYLPRFLEGVAASDPALMQDDGIHPTALAQPRLAQKVEDGITPMLTH